METDTTLQQLLAETRKIYTLLANHANGKTAPSTERPTETEKPEHVDVEWITDYFAISKTTFYKGVRNKLLFPVLHIGRRSYYLKSEAVALMAKQKNTHLGLGKLGALLKKYRK